MARHRRPVPTRSAAVADRARRHVAAGLFGVSALAATFLAVAVEPAAPPAPDRGPAASSSELAQLSIK
jgi:membrane protein YqaA with SNARE-associated domain